MFLADIIYSKFIANKGVADRSRDVVPKARGVCHFVVPVLGKTFLEKFVGKLSSLW